MEQHAQPEGLDSFSPPVQKWFRDTFGRPTPPQQAGWPPIQRGEHTLLLAPTGSGKTLAAFLWGIDRVFCEAPSGETGGAPGIRLLYISPLKALNNDVERNLRIPLAGIRRAAARLGLDRPDIHVAVRSGDTPPRERRAVLQRPPHIFITTPESLYLMLTSPRARGLFRTVHTVIVDEIHTLAGTKRGVHLSLSLERLQHLAEGRIQRIGLSATIRPLDEVARFLGGAEWTQSQDPTRATDSSAGHEGRDGTLEAELRPRPVTVVDAGYRKPLDLRVETVVPGFRNPPGGSIWPVLIARMTSLIDEHRTTLIFANSRRLAERTADRLNEQRAAEARGEPSGLLQMGVAVGSGFTAVGAGDHENPIRAHHGSMSREARLEMEQDLKAGRLDALVGTSSLQLGIDIGSVDLVAQLGSPKAVSEGLQRVGRSGHLVGQTSVGRIFPLHREDLVEAAAVAGGMLRGEVETTITPHAPLDVLAQQVVAAVATDSWRADDLFRLVRQAYPYRALTLPSFHAVLDMLSGRYPAQTHRQLRARLSWDRVNGLLAAVPGSRLQATSNPGTITDHGSFGAYLPDGKTRLGELDEEFVFETRVGDTFMLGAQVWRVLEITDDRVVVGEAPGSTPRMPFWKGDYPWRPYELGCRVGAFRREVAERLMGLRDRWGVETCRAVLEAAAPDAEDLQSPGAAGACAGPAAAHAAPGALADTRAWLSRDYALDPASVDTILDYAAAQVDRIGTVASDTTIVLEVFDDPLGDPRLVIHSPFGGRVNGPWSLVLAALLRERTGVQVEAQTSDDGILLRFPDSDADFPLNLLDGLGPDEARRRLLEELPNSAVFGAQFRQNAARALLLPGLRGGRRTPFWLQRLRARDLLQVVKAFPDFPILLETYRDCLEDVMDLPHLEQVLSAVERGEIQTVVAESLTPSPAAQSLMRDFITIHMYEWDAPKAERRFQDLALNLELLQDLLRDVDLAQLLKPEALQEVESRLHHTAPGTKARTADELALILEAGGDLSSLEAAERSAGDAQAWLQELAAAGRITEISIPTAGGPARRWIPIEYHDAYQAAFAPSGRSRTGRSPADAEPPDAPPDPTAARHILERFIAGTGPVTLDAILDRYAFPSAWAAETLEKLVSARRVAHGHFTPHMETPAAAAPEEYVDTRVLEQLHRRSLSLLRHEIKSVPHTAYAAFLCEWQHVTATTRLQGSAGLQRVLQQMRGLFLPAVVWDRDALPARVSPYLPGSLDELCAAGELMWVCSGAVASGRARLAFLFRGEGGMLLPPAGDAATLGTDTGRVYEFLREEGAAFLAEVAAGLGLGPAQAEAALLELMLAGLVTNDDIGVARRLLLDTGPGSGRSMTQPPTQFPHPRAGRLSPLPAQPGLHGRPARRDVRAAEQRVRRRLEQEEARARAGRWALLKRTGIGGREAAAEERSGFRARLLLARHGVLTRKALEHEGPGWDWTELVQVLMRMEIRGEIRRGYFVQGLPGPQFALPDAIEHLRDAAGRIVVAAPQPETELVILNACDPANTYGPPLVTRVPSTWLVLDRGYPLLVAADSGTRLSSPEGADPQDLTRAATALVNRLRRVQTRTIAVTWNGEAATCGPWRGYLEEAGFYPDGPGMSWDGW